MPRFDVLVRVLVRSIAATFGDRLSCLIRMRVAAAMTLAALTLGCGSSPRDGGAASNDDRPKVAYVTNGVASFWVIAEAGVEKGGEEFDAETETVMPADATDQQRILKDLVSRGFDGIAVSPIDPTNQTGLLNELSGFTNVITHDSDAPDSDRLCYIGVDNYDAGRLCGELVREAIPDGGKVAIFVGRLEQDNAERRRRGMIDALLGVDAADTKPYPPDATPSGDGYTIIGTYTDQFERAMAKANAEDVLSRHTDVAAMVGLFAYNPGMILEALKQADRQGDVAVIAFDEADETLRGITEGHVYGTVVQNPFEYGRQSVRVLAGLARGNTLADLGFDESAIKHIPARQIRSDNVAEFWNELKINLGEAPAEASSEDETADASATDSSIAPSSTADDREDVAARQFETVSPKSTDIAMDGPNGRAKRRAAACRRS